MRSSICRALRGPPRAAWACALIAILNAGCWSLITPPFQSPDEPSHFAYVQQLAETGELPTSDGSVLSQEEEVVLLDLHQAEVQWHPEVHTISSGSAQARLRDDLARPLGRVGPGDAGVAASEPPAYYALETIPYYLGSAGSLLDRLELMRLLSALMAGLTALFAFLFVCEALPRVPWAWTVGGLGVALWPLLGFTSGAVTPDAMLFAVSSMIFYCFARAFRRGFTRKLAVAIGTLTAVGFLTKLNFIGLAPGVMLALVLLAFRGRPAQPSTLRPKREFGSMAVAMAIGLSPICIYLAFSGIAPHHTLGLVSSTIRTTGERESLIDKALYVWEFYLPRLPGMKNDFPGLFTIRQLWFDRAVGRYGWIDTSFPTWVYSIALIPAGVIALLGLRTLVTSRGILPRRLPELLVYLGMTAGLMVLVATDSNVGRAIEGTAYAQPRYLLPLLPLLGGALALSARAPGRRWGPAAGALIVVLILALDLFSQLQLVARYYG